MITNHIMKTPFSSSRPTSL